MSVPFLASLSSQERGEGRMRLEIPNDLAVDSAGNAVLEFEVHFRDGVLGEDGRIRDIT